MSDRGTCASCEWWYVEYYEEQIRELEGGKGGFVGDCRRNPPAPIPWEEAEADLISNAYWTRTLGEYWCGEWKLRETPLVPLRGKAELAVLFENVGSMADEDFQSVFSSLETDERIDLFHGCFTDEEREAGDIETALFRERLAVYLPFYLSLEDAGSLSERKPTL